MAVELPIVGICARHALAGLIREAQSGITYRLTEQDKTTCLLGKYEGVYDGFSIFTDFTDTDAYIDIFMWSAFYDLTKEKKQQLEW